MSEKKMFRWQKLGRVFNPAETGNGQWMSEFAQAPAALVFDDYVRVYFSTRPASDASGKYVSYSAFVDLDKNNLFEIKGLSKEPIISLGETGNFDEFGIYPVSVIRRGDEFWCYYAGWTRCESVPFNVAIGLAISLDGGITFKKIGPGPVLSYSIHEPFVLSGPKIRFFNNQFYLFYIAGYKWIMDNGKPEPVYKIRVAVSEDGLNWRKIDKNLIPDKLNEYEAQASPDVIYANGKYHMFYCYRHGSDYRNANRGYRIGYAYSDDLINWIRDDERAGIDVSSEGWDAEMISYPHVMELEGKHYMFYLGNQVGRFGFGLARLEGELK